MFHWFAKHLFKLITEREYLVMDTKTKTLSIGKHVLSIEETKAISKSAKDLVNNDAYVLVMRELFALAEKKIYFESRTEDDLVFTKATMWTLEQIKNKVENMSRLM